MSLYCAERKILIAGDQILPSITTNVSTWHVEPEFDAVGAFLKTCKTFLDVLHPDTLILPSHRKPFRNVQHRLRQLAVHHAVRLNVILDKAGAETCAGDLIDVMFTPGLDGHQIGFAMGEAIAHLNHLVTLGHMQMVETPAQVRYRRISAKDARVEPGVRMMPGPFGDHQLKIPYEPVADLLAKYAKRDPAKTAIVDLETGTSIDFGQLDRDRHRHRGVSQEQGHREGQPRPGAVRRVPGKAADLVRRLADRRGDLPVQSGDQRKADGQPDRCAEARADPLSQGHRRRGDGRRRAGRARPLRRLVGGRREGPAGRAVRRAAAAATRRSLPERNDADDTACIFCTSGTTARPKIVIYNHAAYWMNGLDTLEFLGLTEDDRTLEYRSFGWNSAQVLSLLPFLQKGLTMHIAKRFSHSRFFEWVQRHGITFSAGVPTVLNILLNKPIGYTAKDVPTLRLMSCSTAPLTAQQWLQFEEMYGVTLLQMYGMSETGWVCGNRHYAKKMGTVGLPALHQELVIVDAAGNECPPDVEGEITVGGPQMAIGYLLDDGSIDPVLGKRIKTGDLGIKDAEGFIRVTGRSKDLIIRGGVNIAPLEIDEVLLKHPGVARGRRGRRAGQDLWRGGRVLRRGEGPDADRSRGAGALRDNSCRRPRRRSRF